jgi:hypothetical protein
MLRLMAAAAAPAMLFLSLRINGKTISGAGLTGARVRAAHPGIDPDELKRRARNPARDGCWPQLVGTSGPIL